MGALLGSGFVMYYNIDVLPSGSILSIIAGRGIQEVSLIHTIFSLCWLDSMGPRAPLPYPSSTTHE